MIQGARLETLAVQIDMLCAGDRDLCAYRAVLLQPMSDRVTPAQRASLHRFPEDAWRSCVSMCVEKVSC